MLGSDSVKANHHVDLNSIGNKLEKTRKTGCWQLTRHKILYPPNVYHNARSVYDDKMFKVKLTGCIVITMVYN